MGGMLPFNYYSYAHRRLHNMNKRKSLRRLIERPEILIAPGAYDAFSAKLVEAAGFKAVYMTGFGTAASMFGLPDIGLLTQTEMCENARRMANAVNIPLIADADTGYGNHLNAMRTMEEYEKAGIAAIQIEDQVAPKRCGHMVGQRVIPIEEMVPKIRAMVAARKDKDMLIIARTDAISAEGFDQAIKRGNIYYKEGADIIFVEAPTTVEDLARIPKLIDGPVLVNLAPKTPFMHSREYEKMGYNLAIYPPLCITTAYAAMKSKLQELKRTGTMSDGCHAGVPFDELVNFLGLADWRAAEAEFLADAEKYKI
jgi:carboxyvinyl-carboxyphosphonate phosphorylmutase